MLTNRDGGKLSVMTKSKDALHKAHQKRTAREEEYKKAMNWCKREKKGANLHEQWQGFSLTTLQRRLSRKEVPNAPQNANIILTPLEEKELAEWINDCALSRAGKYREEIADKVREIIKARHKANRRGGRCHVPLSTSATRILTGGGVTKDWFARYFAEHADKIKWHVPENIDTQRAATNTEEAVEAHFECIYGLR